MNRFWTILFCLTMLLIINVGAVQAAEKPYWELSQSEKRKFDRVQIRLLWQALVHNSNGAYFVRRKLVQQKGNYSIEIKHRGYRLRLTLPESNMESILPSKTAGTRKDPIDVEASSKNTESEQEIIFTWMRFDAHNLIQDYDSYVDGIVLIVHPKYAATMDSSEQAKAAPALFKPRRQKLVDTCGSEAVTKLDQALNFIVRTKK